MGRLESTRGFSLSGSIIGSALEAIITKNEVQAALLEIPDFVADWKSILLRTRALRWRGERKLKLG